MPYLLDTHTLLWMHEDSPFLSRDVKKVLTDSSSELYVSIVSFWEITIKQSLGKLQLSYTLEELFKVCISNQMYIIPLQLSALGILKDLPFLHRDPFDRLLISAAIDLNCSIISKDKSFREYDVKTFW